MANVSQVNSDDPSASSSASVKSSDVRSVVDQVSSNSASNIKTNKDSTKKEGDEVLNKLLSDRVLGAIIDPNAADKNSAANKLNNRKSKYTSTAE